MGEASLKLDHFIIMIIFVIHKDPYRSELAVTEA